MSSIAFAYKPTIVIATVSREFTDCGYSSNNILVIRKINAGSWQTYDPTLPASSISGYEKGAAYLFVSKIDLDLTGLAYNTLPENYESVSGNNIFANQWFAGIARQTADFTTIGFNATNLRIIYKVDIPYESFDPNEAVSAISGIVEGQCYLGFALADQDVSAYFIPPVTIKDDITRQTDEFKYFGTTDVVDGTGATVKDFYNVPVRFFADEASRPATGVENIVYVAKAEKTSWYWDGAAYQQIGGGGGITTETDPTVPTLVKNIPVSADAATNKYLNWNGTAYTRKQIAYSELSGTPSIATAATLVKPGNANYSATAIEQAIVFETTLTGNRTLTIPTATGNTGLRISIGNFQTATFTITLSCVSSILYNGSAIGVLSKGDWITIMSDGTSWYVVQSVGKIGSGVFILKGYGTQSTLANSATTDNLFPYTLPANSLNKKGDRLRITFWWLCTGGGSDNITARIKSGANTIIARASTGFGQSNYNTMTMDFVYDAATSTLQFNNYYASGSFVSSNVGSSTSLIDWTSANDFNVGFTTGATTSVQPIFCQYEIYKE